MAKAFSQKMCLTSNDFMIKGPLWQCRRLRCSEEGLQIGQQAPAVQPEIGSKFWNPFGSIW